MLMQRATREKANDAGKEKAASFVLKDGRGEVFKPQVKGLALDRGHVFLYSTGERGKGG